MDLMKEAIDSKVSKADFECVQTELEHAKNETETRFINCEKDLDEFIATMQNELTSLK